MKNKLQFISLICCLLLVSFISGLPHLAGLKMFGSNYHSFTFNSSLTAHEEAFNYMVRTKQILRGNFLLGDQQIYEYQLSPHPFISELLPSFVMAGFSLVVGSVDKGFMLADFILPPLIFILIFYFVKLLTKNWLFAILASLGTIFVRDLMMYIPYPLPLLKFLFLPANFIDNLVITRSFHPEVSLIFFLLALISVYKLLVFGKKIDYLLAGIFTGLLFYVYIFYWTAFYFGLFIFFFINIKNCEIRKKMLIVAGFCLLIGVFYFYRQYQFRISNFSTDFVFRSTGFRDEFPLPESRRFVVISIVLFVFFWIWKKRKSLRMYDLYLNSLIFAGAIIPDLSSILLKKDLESIHWIWVYVLPLSSIYYFCLLKERILIFISSKLTKLVYFFLVFSFIFYAVKIQTQVVKIYTVKQKFSLEENQLIRYLNSIKGRVVINTVFSDQSFKGTNIYIPVLTPHFVYVPHAGLTVAPNEEITKRSLVALSFIKPVNSSLQNKEVDMILSNAYGFLNASYVRTNIKSMRSKMSFLYKKVDLFCKNYKMDYLIVNASDSKFTHNNNCFVVKKMFSDSRFTVFKINKTQNEKTFDLKYNN